MRKKFTTGPRQPPLWKCVAAAVLPSVSSVAYCMLMQMGDRNLTGLNGFVTFWVTLCFIGAGLGAWSYTRKPTNLLEGAMGIGFLAAAIVTFIYSGTMVAGRPQHDWTKIPAASAKR